MFDLKQLESIDRNYFNVIVASEYDVTIQSKNTGHYWYLHSTDAPGSNACIIFHKHKFSHPYHQHGRGNSLRQAIKSIQRHDRWQKSWWNHE